MKVNFGAQMLLVARRFTDREALVNIERGRRYSFMDYHLDHVKAEIGRYKAPKSTTFVDVLPMSVAGKVLRRKVREKCWKGEQRNDS